MYENVLEKRPALSAYVRPTGFSVNPRSPDFPPTGTLYVMYKLSERRTRATRVLSRNEPVLGWTIGQVIALSQDATGASLGEYKIVGVHDVGSGEMAGDLPDISIKHAVVSVA